MRRTAKTGCLPSDDQPLALWVEGGHGPVIHAANAAAVQAGVRMGARLADTRTICPGLRAEAADPQGDAAALDRLALWARRFCPWTAADRSAPDAALGGGAGLVMDTSGADHLWGGEAGMLAAIEGDLAVRGLTARVAVAQTWGAAWGLARFGPVRAQAADMAALHPLPVGALRLTPGTVLLLRRLGLTRVADLAAIPRLSLARRFRRLPPADNPLIRLDQAAGRLAEPLNPPDLPPAFRASARLPEPVLDAAQNLPALCDQLCRDLAAAHLGARLLRLSVWRVDGSLRWIEAGAATATRDPAHVAFLFRERLERIDPGYGFDLIELSAPQTAPLLPDQHDLTGETQAGPTLPQLLDRLSARFGPNRVTRPVAQGSHVPERAMREAAVDGATMMPPLPAGDHGRGSLALAVHRPAAAPPLPDSVAPPPGTRPENVIAFAGRAGECTRSDAGGGAGNGRGDGAGSNAGAALASSGAGAGCGIAPFPDERKVAPPRSPVAQCGGPVPRLIVGSEGPAARDHRGDGNAVPTFGRGGDEGWGSGSALGEGDSASSSTDAAAASSDTGAGSGENEGEGIGGGPGVGAGCGAGAEEGSSAGGTGDDAPGTAASGAGFRAASSRNGTVPEHGNATAPACKAALIACPSPVLPSPVLPSSVLPSSALHSSVPPSSAPLLSARAPSARLPCAAILVAPPSLAMAPSTFSASAPPPASPSTALPSLAPPRSASPRSAPPPASPPASPSSARPPFALPPSTRQPSAPSPSTRPPSAAALPLSLRPLRLFDPPAEVRVLYAVPEGPPARFLWRGQTCHVARWAGPERIAPEWWADRPRTRLRDYYRVEDAAGLRLWLYREGLAGDGRGGAPRWFVHGMFA